MGSVLFFGDASLLFPLMLIGASAEDRLHEMADWHFQRVLNTARACVGTSVTFLTALLVSQFKAEFKVSAVWIALAAAGAGLVAAYGLFAYSRLRRQNRIYADSLLILKLFQPFFPQP